MNSTRFLSADFVNEDQTVLYIDPAGLWRYDLTTSTLELLDEGINTDWVDYAWFSPDGQWVALIDVIVFASPFSSLYVLPVP